MAITIALIVYVHDILFTTNVIHHQWGYLVFGGIAQFVLFQMIIQAMRIRQFQEEKNQSELKFLQSQIKPHFLYNTLNAFVSISRYDMEKARRLLVDFSHYLRQSFDFKSIDAFVPLKDEIALARSYVKIAKVRFEERMDAQFDVDDALMHHADAPVPILILQPLIENAVEHGVLPKPEGGRVEISISRKKKGLGFSIRDTGVGMDSDLLKKIRSETVKHGKGNAGTDIKKSGTGIKNIDRRLKKLYRQGLIIKSTVGEGTEISWHIKVKKWQ